MQEASTTGVIFPTWLLGQPTCPSQDINWPLSVPSFLSHPLLTCYLYPIWLYPHISLHFTLSITLYLSIFHRPFSFTYLFYPHAVSSDLPVALTLVALIAMIKAISFSLAPPTLGQTAVCPLLFLFHHQNLIPFPSGPVKVLSCPPGYHISIQFFTCGLLTTLVMEAVNTSETLIYLYETTQYHIPEGCYIHANYLIIIIIIIIFHHEYRPGWPVSVSAFMSSSSLFIGHPGHCLPFG
jgi:hypothetical protein